LGDQVSIFGFDSARLHSTDAAMADINRLISLSVKTEKSSGNTIQRTPLSKQRNKHLQRTLIEAAKMALRNSPDLAMIYDREKQKGNANRATLAVARKLVAYLVAVDRRRKDFLTVEKENRTAA
jgi:transposase